MDSQKVKQFTANPFATLYFPNTNLNPKEFRSIAISGRISRITDETELICALEQLGAKAPFHRNQMDKEWFEDWAIYKLTSDTLQFTDMAKPKRTVKIEL